MPFSVSALPAEPPPSAPLVYTFTSPLAVQALPAVVHFLRTLARRIWRSWS